MIDKQTNHVDRIDRSGTEQTPNGHNSISTPTPSRLVVTAPLHSNTPLEHTTNSTDYINQNTQQKGMHRRRKRKPNRTLLPQEPPLPRSRRSLHHPFDSRDDEKLEEEDEEPQEEKLEEEEDEEPQEEEDEELLEEEEVPFMERLSNFFTAQGQELVVPMFNHSELQVEALWELVQELGGYHAAVEKKRWATIAQQLGCPKEIKSGSTRMRRHYERLLLPFEESLEGSKYKRKDKNKDASKNIQKPRPTAATAGVGGSERRRKRKRSHQNFIPTTSEDDEEISEEDAEVDIVVPPPSKRHRHHHKDQLHNNNTPHRHRHRDQVDEAEVAQQLITLAEPRTTHAAFTEEESRSGGGGDDENPTTIDQNGREEELSDGGGSGGHHRTTTPLAPRHHNSPDLLVAHQDEEQHEQQQRQQQNFLHPAQPSPTTTLPAAAAPPAAADHSNATHEVNINRSIYTLRTAIHTAHAALTRDRGGGGGGAPTAASRHPSLSGALVIADTALATNPDDVSSALSIAASLISTLSGVIVEVRLEKDDVQRNAMALMESAMERGAAMETRHTLMMMMMQRNSMNTINSGGGGGGGGGMPSAPSYPPFMHPAPEQPHYTLPLYTAAAAVPSVPSTAAAAAAAGDAERGRRAELVQLMPPQQQRYYAADDGRTAAEPNATSNGMDASHSDTMPEGETIAAAHNNINNNSVHAAAAAAVRQNSQNRMKEGGGCAWEDLLDIWTQNKLP